MTWGTLRVLVFFALVAAIIPAFNMLRKSIKKKSCTAQVDGVVTRYVSRCVHDTDNQMHTVYDTKYTYSVDGVEYKGSVTLKSTVGEAFTVYTEGENIPLHYNPFNPKRHYIEKIRVFWGMWTWACSLISAIFLIIAIWIFVSELLPALKK